jgi:hypothetical protein
MGNIPTQAEYEQQEALMHQKRLDEIEQAPLDGRRDAQTAFFACAISDPATIGERIEWILSGSYGFGACKAAAGIVAQKRGNREAALCQLVAALEWMCPRNFAVQAYKSLTVKQQKEVNAAIRRAMKTEAAVNVE